MKHEIRALGLAIAALLLQGGLAGERALATCGDYVLTGAHGIDAPAGAMLAYTDEIARHVADRADPTNRPCRGPNCSRRSAPPGVPPTTLPSHSHDWILPPVALCEFSPEPVDAVHLHCRPHAVLRASIVFRPPRPSV
ncbi:MAG TPA: hypothetical protein VG826_17640 [Pirellulales bacterium]|nr:hypothetical protein [Pirellulales bacterium]